MFPAAEDPRPAFGNDAIATIRAEARQMIGRLRRLAKNAPSPPEDAQSAEAFLAAIGMAATMVPELSRSTTLRRRWQEFALGGASAVPGDEQSAADVEPSDDDDHTPTA